MAPAAQRHAEAHAGRGGRHLQMVKERCEVGIGRRVIDNEPGIDGHKSVAGRAVNGVRMPANVPARFKQRDPMAL